MSGTPTPSTESYFFALGSDEMSRWIKEASKPLRPSYSGAAIGSKFMTFKGFPHEGKSALSALRTVSWVSGEVVCKLKLEDRLKGVALSQFHSYRIYSLQSSQGDELEAFLKLRLSSEIKVGDRVLDIIIDKTAVWVCTHQQGPGDYRSNPIELSQNGEKKISRSYFKTAHVFSGALEGVGEGSQRGGEGKQFVVIGASPGGMVQYLLEKYMHAKVLAIDPAPLDPLLVSPRLTYKSLSMAEVRDQDLPPKVDWVIIDVNLDAAIVSHQAQRFSRMGLPQMMVTLKIGDPDRALEALMDSKAKLARAGYRHVMVRHLPSNGKEVTLLALL